LRGITGLFGVFSNKSLTCENAWSDAGIARSCFSPIHAMQAASILAALSAAGMPTGVRMPFAEASNIIEVRKAR